MIKLLMRFQAPDFMMLHDDLPKIRTQELAVQDAKTIFEQKNKLRGHVPSKQSKRAAR